jgi:hypothetical protein
MKMTTKQQKMFAERMIELYLYFIQEQTGNYLDTLELLEKEPKDILLIQPEEIRYYLCAIKVCLQTVLLKQMEVKYTGSEFKVKLKPYK